MKILDAFKIAAQAHAGQVDKAGRPYIEHVSRVFLRVAERGGDRDQQIAALLHDVIEDGRRTRDELVNAGVPSGAIELVVKLTRPAGVAYLEYVSNCASDLRVALIKRADLDDNADPERLASLDADTAARLRSKYAKAFIALSNGVEAQQPDRSVDGQAMAGIAPRLGYKFDTALELTRTKLMASPSTLSAQDAAQEVLREMYDLDARDGIFSGSLAAFELGYGGFPDEDLMAKISCDVAQQVEQVIQAEQANRPTVGA